MGISNIQKNKSSKNPIFLELKPKNDKYDNKYIARDIKRRNKLLKSFCPELYQQFHAKLAIILSCIGAPFYYDEEKSVSRGNINVFLYGKVHSGRTDILNFING